MVSFVAYLRVVKPLRQRRRSWRIVEVRRERGDSCSLVVEAVGHEGLRFAPGEFAWIKIHSPFTLDEHPFSFSSSATKTRRVEFGVKALGDFTRRLADTPPGTAVYLDGPHGAFGIDRYPAPGYVFIAGGIGITPFMACLRTMAERGDHRPVVLIYAVKSWDAATFREAIAALTDRLTLTVFYVLEQPHDGWTGDHGFIDAELLARRLPADSLPRDYLLCGPSPMMNAVRDALHGRGITDEHIHSERFNLV